MALRKNSVKFFTDTNIFPYWFVLVAFGAGGTFH